MSYRVPYYFRVRVGFRNIFIKQVAIVRIYYLHSISLKVQEYSGQCNILALYGTGLHSILAHLNGLRSVAMGTFHQAQTDHDL